MENSTSEQQLRQLLDEGKINEEEYLQLLSSMNKSTSETWPYSLYEKPKMPVSLIIVACLFILGGILALIEIISAFMRGKISLNIGVIGIFIGWGLLAFNRGWRIAALIFLILIIIFIPIASMFYINQPSSGFSVHVFGNKLPRDPKLIFLIDIICLLPVIWSYWVLTRPKIKSFFGIKNN